MKALEAVGGVEGVKAAMNRTLAGVQGSGWAWLVKDRETGQVRVKSYAVSFLLVWFYYGGRGVGGMNGWGDGDEEGANVFRG